MGAPMGNFTAEKSVDFVDRVIPNSRESIVQRVEEGCTTFLENGSFWQRARQLAATEANYQPPDGSVRLAKAAFAGAWLARKRERTANRIKLLFDSFLQPALAGFRSTRAGTRQLLYRADPFQIDIQVEAKPDSNSIIVTGQLLDLNHPEYIAQDIRVLLSNMRGQSIHTITNGFGEFREEIENTGDLQMTFAQPGGDPIVISLQEVLGPQPEGEM